MKRPVNRLQFTGRFFSLSHKHIIIRIVSTVAVVAAFTFDYEIVYTVNGSDFVFAGGSVPFAE